ncbi:ABC transporter ATP-binding protein [Telmatospirillum sp. J64-1]|uniref:ABC transporter ATP-binding protein n=1 Tax=Telmatospirillum sp. J64-1 TaxID=2502183 RepID=UPI00115E6A22|nr:ABC transporter ATP-binding protein [Telmatospirillum sp. J64-1]
MKETRIVLDGTAPVTEGEGLVLDDVGHSYGGRVVVDGVSLAVEPGELVCLLGPSGCGKTTTLRIAAGLERPETGRVMLNRRVVSQGQGGVHIPPEDRNVGFLFQDYALFPHLSVFDNVAFGLRHWPVAERRQRIHEVLVQVGMEAYASAYPHMLSGGQQQRIALARALAPGPRLMLLDEPFSGLDSRLRDQVRDQTLHVLKEAGVSTLMVTHDPEEAMFMADRIALMRDGRIVQLGRPVDLYCNPVEAFVANFFGEVNRITGKVRGGEVETPFGRLSAPGLGEGAEAEILIRPEALFLSPAEGDEGDGAAKVVASRLLGRSSLVHLCVGDAQGAHLHLHSRMPGRFLPAEDEIMKVRLDRGQCFVFPAQKG